MCFLNTEHLLRHIVRDAPGPYLWPVPVAADATLAWRGARRPRVGRESQRQKEGHPHGRRSRRHFRRLLVPDTGESSESEHVVVSDMTPFPVVEAGYPGCQMRVQRVERETGRRFHYRYKKHLFRFDC
jgi:hypothetical protein